MKTEKRLKVVLAILVIILISLVSFGGIFVQNTKFVEDIVPKYELGMELEGGRVITLEVDNSTETVIYDANGNVVTEEGDDTTTVEEPINPDDALTVENYEKAKEIIASRIEDMGVEEYTIRLDETNGKIYVQLPEDSATDLVCTYMAIKGVFTVTNDDGDILLDNSHIKKAQVGYSTSTSGTAVYLTIQLNKEGTQIFKDISNTYVETTDEEGNDTTEEISLNIDDVTLLSTYFDSEISNGAIQISIGDASTDTDTIQTYLQEASNLAIMLNSGSLPLTYSIEGNRYVKSDIIEEMLYIPAIAMGVIILIGLVFLVIKYKKNGALGSVAFIGYIATLWLVLRYANVVLTLAGMVAIVISATLEYIFTVYLLSLINRKNSKTMAEVSNTFKEALIKSLVLFIPIAITAVILCFVNWTPLYSFGMITFWGLLIIVLYNLIFTRTLIVDTKKNK